MATGDQADFVTRLRRMLPRGWWGDISSTPFLSGILAGLSYAHASVFSWTTFARQQIRLATASGEFLDWLASDFLGNAISRHTGETDASFRSRIRAQILQPKATRAAVVSAVQSLTGNLPTVVEPALASDTGGYGSSTVSGQGGGVGYGTAGAYGSLQLPFQCFLTVQRPITPGIPGVAGYGAGAGYGSRAAPGVNVGPSEYASLDQLTGVRDADILALIAATAPVATVVWTRIVDPTPDAGARLDIDFYLDRSVLG